ncbi:hypothetical protein, partial [Prevotella jejuni]|uniref:hypothetical protein n=1 Tax=Prevotella jejuni TaxID=1177574 RepID=UPI00352E6196
MSQRWIASDAFPLIAPLQARGRSPPILFTSKQQAEYVNYFRPSPIMSMPFNAQENALLHPRTCPSCTLKTPFLMQEGHVLNS